MKAALMLIPVASLLVPACGGSSGADKSTKARWSEAAMADDDRSGPEPALQSDDIMAREPLANEVTVRHILISWSDLAGSYGGGMDPRARERTLQEAETLVSELHRRAVAGEDFQALMAEHSEDRGSAASGATIKVTPSASLVLDFKRLSLRLKVGEVGIALTSFGYHIIKRIS